MLVTPIRKVLGSNLVWDICIMFSWFSSVHPAIFRANTSIMPRPFPSKSYPINYSAIILSFNAAQSSNCSVNYFSPLHLMVETDPVSETSCLKWWNSERGTMSQIIVIFKNNGNHTRRSLPCKWEGSFCSIFIPLAFWNHEGHLLHVLRPLTRGYFYKLLNLWPGSRPERRDDWGEVLTNGLKYTNFS
jgi:hypothetical protein